MRKIYLALAFLALFFVGCDSKTTASNDSEKQEVAQKTELDKIKEKGIIKIGVFSDKPPFGYVDKDGKNQGYDVYFAKRIAKDLLDDENKVEFVLVEAASRVEFLKANKVDIILANFTNTPERAKQVDFALPYMKVSLGVVSPEGAVIKDISELKGKTLIVNKGTTADAYFTKNHPEINLLKFDQNTETFAALIDKRGDALAHDNTLIFAWVKENAGFSVGIKELGNIDAIAPAVKKGNQSLLKWLNAEIKSLKPENFFHKAYDETLAPVYGDSVSADSVVVEGGEF